MSEIMTFPETVDEFMEKYKIVDTEKVYTNGIELVPIFRMKQWFEHLPAAPREREFLVAYKRMCASFPETDCSKCPIYTPYKDCTDNPCDWDIDKILPAVERWAREHPEEVNDV